jgi:hypothetical protein
MPTNRTRRTRTRQSIGLDDTIKVFLFSGKKPERDTPAWDLYVSRHFDGMTKIRAAWEEHREFLLKEWKKAGRKGRPWAARMFGNE